MQRRMPLRIVSTAMLAAAVGLGLTGHAWAADQNELLQIAKDAYVYGYSLMTTGGTRVQMSNVEKVAYGRMQPNLPALPSI